MGCQENRNFPTWIIIRFQQRDGQDSQNLNNATLCRLLDTSAQFVFGTEKYSDAGIIVNYDDDDYGQAYGVIEEALRAFSKDDLLQLFISDHDFRSLNL